MDHPATEMAILIPGSSLLRRLSHNRYESPTRLPPRQPKGTHVPWEMPANAVSRDRLQASLYASTARVRLPVSLCHIANSKNAREFNASRKPLRRVKLRTVNSHFATLPVRHWASGMYLRSHLQRNHRWSTPRRRDHGSPSKLHPIDSRCCVLAIML